MTRKLFTWQEQEDETLRRQTGVHSWGKTFQRSYDVPHGLADSQLPTRGDEMLDETSGLTCPKVMNWHWAKDPRGAVRLVVEWGQAVAFTDATGDPLELRGSRVTTEDATYRYGTRIYAATADTKADDIPTLFTNDAGTADSGLLSRRKVSVTKNNDVLPGVWILTATYHGFFLFTGATGDPLELQGSRTTSTDGTYRYATRIYVASVETKGDDIPDLFTNAAGVADSGLLSRRKVSVASDNKLVPGVWLLEAKYHGFYVYTGATGDPLELQGSRVANTDGKYKYGTRIYVASAEAKADDIATLFTDDAGATDADTRLARRKASVATNNDLVPGVWLLTAQYIGFESHEQMFMRDYDANSLQGEKGTRVFVEKSANAVTLCKSLRNSAFPGVTPKVPCTAARAQWEPFGIPNIAFIRATYGQPILAYSRKVGYMRLSAKVMSRSKRKVMRDLDQKVIEGWDGTELWSVVPHPKTGRTGTNEIDDTVVFLRIETAVFDNTGLLADAIALKDHINSDGFDLAIYGNVPKETFRCVGTEILSTYEAKITPLNWYIEVEPGGWNDTLYSQKSRYKPVQIPIYTAAGVDSGKTQAVKTIQVGYDSAGKTTKAEVRRIHPAAAFGRFMRGLKKWTVQ